MILQDVDSESILHHEYFLLKARFAEEEHTVEFYVPLTEPMPPQYFIRVLSDRWIGCEAQLPVSFRHLLLPEKFNACTELLDLQPTPVQMLQSAAFEAIYADQFPFFNPIQTQVFNTLYNTDENVFIGAPSGSGLTVCGELALLRFLAHGAPGERCVYVAPMQTLVNRRLADWQRRIGDTLGKRFVALTGDATTDVKLFAKADVTLATPEQWDVLSRRWKQRKTVQSVSLVIADQAHMLGSGQNGPTIEVVLSRMRHIAAQLERPIRIVALATSVANAKDMGLWLGCSGHNTYNFHPSVRPEPLELHIQGFNVHFADHRLVAMTRPVYNAIMRHTTFEPVIVFVPSRVQSQQLALDLLTNAAAEGRPQQFLHCQPEELAPHLAKVTSTVLRETLESGIGFLHTGLSTADRRLVEYLYSAGAIQVVVVARELVWDLPLHAKLVVVQDTQYYDGREHRFVDYPITDMLRMLGRAVHTVHDRAARGGNVAVVLCQTSKKPFYKKFLADPLPVESHLDHVMHDPFCAEIVARTLENKQDAVDWTTWTFLYHRLTKNPNYYNLTGVTHSHLSDFLSELVETTLTDLEASKCIAIDEDDDSVEPLNLGMISSFYYLSYSTMEIFSRSLTATTKFRGLVEILCAASEFDTLTIRRGENRVLAALAKRLPSGPRETARFHDPHVKTELLLHAHLSRVSLTPELQSDLEEVLPKLLRLVLAAVDICSSSGWLEPAVCAMELSQLMVQALRPDDPILKQVPHMGRAALQRAKDKGVQSVFDLIDLEDADRNDVLQMDKAQLADVARFCNRYPSIVLEHEVEDADALHAGAPVSIAVTLERDDEEAQAGPVIAPFFPQRKDENWWLVLGETATNTLLAIKRLTTVQSTVLSFPAPAPGQHDCVLYFICDSYTGCDQEYEISLNIHEAQKDDHMGDDDEDEDD